MLLVHLLHLFLLILPSHFLPSALNVLYVFDRFNVIPHLPQLSSMLLLRLKLTFLIFVDPRNGFYINVELLEGGDILAEYLFNPGYPEKQERVSNHPNIHIFELEYILEVVLLISPNV